MEENPEVVTVAATRADGGLTVSRFIISKDNPVITPELINATYARKARDTGKVIVSWEIVPNDYLVEGETDDSYRNAWKHSKDGRKPDHDMPKAREIHRVHLRKARLREFCRLDNEYRLAEEADDVPSKKALGAIKQKFRDVTEDPRIEQAQTVEELKALRLEALVPETLGESYMQNKMKISPAIPGVAATLPKDK